MKIRTNLSPPQALEMASNDAKSLRKSTFRFGKGATEHPIRHFGSHPCIQNPKNQQFSDIYSLNPKKDLKFLQINIFPPKSAFLKKGLANSPMYFPVKYSMKCDDDTFVNVPNLIHVLLGGTVPAYKATRHHYNELTMDTLSPKNRLTRSDLLLIGQRIDHAEPITDYKSKWLVWKPSIRLW